MLENNINAPHLGDYFLEITDTFFCVIKEEKVSYLNEMAIHLLGGSKETLTNQHILNIIVDADKELLEEKLKTTSKRSDYFPLRLRTATENVVYINARLIPIFIGDDKIFMLEGYDQAPIIALEKKNKNLEERLTHMSPIDLETHLPTPVLFNDRVDQAILRALREARGVLTNITSFLTVVVVNVLDLKDIEEKMGQDAKRYVLDILISSFKSTIRSVDTIAKPAEDSFYFLFENIKDKNNIQIIIDRLKNCANIPILYKTQSVALKISIGISVYPDNGTSPVTLLKWAKLNPTLAQ